MQIMELVDTLREALQFLNTPEAREAEFLRDDCLMCVTQIQSELAELDDKDYSNICGQCEMAISSKDYKEAYRLSNSLSSWIEERVKAYYEIAFLPYKAEMWDAMESVWFEAKADPNCNVYTVPIPYHTLGSSLEVVSEEYEGDRFPSYVEITHYKDYDLGQHNPDVIFIHNPYDAYNRVTRVHPMYYSDSLVRYTDKLVYIPYFIPLGELNPSLLRLPSAKNAWRTIVDSEWTRREYLESGNLEPEKVLALGSPKLDSILSKINKGLQMPVEWEKALEGRKTFFYNTSLGTLLSDNEKALEGMQEIFKYFKNHPEIAILWRPHPLSISTLRTMRPKLLEPYLKLVDEFKAMPNAVYDDSQEMHTAIVHSHAYIGDFSSVLVPYALTGKPILKQFPNHLRYNPEGWGIDPAWYEHDEEAEIPITLGKGAFHNGLFLSPGINRSGIFAMNMTTNELQFIQGYSDHVYSEAQLFAAAYAYQDFLWLVPEKASKVLSYHFKTGMTKEYEIPSVDSFKGGGKFVTAIEQEEYLWMLPTMSDKLVRLHMATGEMEAIKFPWVDNERRLSCLDGAIHQDQLWIVLDGKKKLLQMNTSTREIKAQKLDFIKSPIHAICSDGQALWFLLESAQLVKWTPETDEATPYDCWPEGFDTGTQPFSGLKFDGEWIWLVPHDANMVMKIHSSRGELSVIYSGLEKSRWSEINPCYPFDSKERNRTIVAKKAMFSGAVIHEGWIWFTPVTAPYLLGVCLETGEVKQIPAAIARIKDEQIFISSRYSNPPIKGLDLRSTFNNRSLHFKHFIDMVCTTNMDTWNEKQRREVGSSLANADGTSGKRIWNYIKGALGGYGEQ